MLGGPAANNMAVEHLLGILAFEGLFARNSVLNALHGLTVDSITTTPPRPPPPTILMLPRQPACVTHIPQSGRVKRNDSHL